MCCAALSCSVLPNSLWPHGLQNARPLCPSPSPEVCPSSCPLYQWCHPAISPSDALFSFCPQSVPASGTFPVNQLLASDDQNTGTSASVLPMSVQDWFPLRLTDLFSLLSKGFSEVFSRTTGINSSALYLFYSPPLTDIHDPQNDLSLDYIYLFQQSNVSAFQHSLGLS